MKEHDRGEQNVHEDDRSGEDRPMDGLDHVVEAGWNIEQIKDDRGGKNPDLEQGEHEGEDSSFLKSVGHKPFNYSDFKELVIVCFKL